MWTKKDKSMWHRIDSAEDASVNFITAADDGGAFEARFVQRTPDYFIVYLSSQSGCRQACRFCHLTATGQTTERGATLDLYLDQARIVLAHARTAANGARVVHYNFMARGEPLANPLFRAEASRIFADLGDLRPDLDSRFLVSTIMPADFTGRLDHVLADRRSRLYYSLYALRPAFRRRWLPRAMDPVRALDLIADYQARTDREIVLHWAFIAGENDDDEGIDAVLEQLHVRGIRARFNLVRYNPYGARHGVEPDEARLQALFERMRRGLGETGSRIVPRVGVDVKASCGMFVERQVA